MRHVMCGLIATLVLLAPGPVSAAPTCGASDKIAGAGDRYFLLAEGDSITFGAASTDGQGSYVPRSCVPKLSGIETVVTAVSGARLGSAADVPGANTLYGRMLKDNAILAAKKGKRIAVLSVLIGRNDLVGYRGGADAYAADLATYIGRMRQAGWDRVIVGTLLPTEWDAFVLPRDDLNTIITTPGWARSHGIDAIADFAGAPDIGPEGTAANKDLFADGIHPTNAGYGVMAPVYDQALKAVIAHRR